MRVHPMVEPDVEEGYAGPEPRPPEPTEALPLPHGLELTEQDGLFRATPYVYLEDLRERDPLHRDAELGCIVLTRHDDVRAALDDPALRRNPAQAQTTSYAALPHFDADHPGAALALDDAAHLAWRTPLDIAFAHPSVAALLPRIDAVITLIIDDIDENEFEFDAYTKFAARVAMSVLADLFGVPKERWLNFRTWATQVIDEYYASAPSAAERDRASAARAELARLFRRAIALRREKPELDVISALLRATGPAGPPSDDAVERQCQTLLLASIAPTAALIGNSLHGLLQNTRQLNRIRQRPELLGNAIEEILRFNAPVLSTLRIATTDTTIAGCPVARGETLLVSLAAANRDPDAYDNPDVLDVLRLDTHHHAFGGGAHFCIGAELARTIAQLAIYGLIMRFEDLELSPLGWEFAEKKGLRILKQFWVRS
jgi:cytochrome P450